MTTSPKEEKYNNQYTDEELDLETTDVEETDETVEETDETADETDETADEADEDEVSDDTEATDDAEAAAEEGSPNGMAAFRKLTAEEDGEIGRHTPVTLTSILGGDILGGQWFRRHFWYMVMLVGMVIVYVSNRYSCQQEMLETKVLSDTLLDRRYKALTRSSQLKERTRRSRIEETLVDTTLRTSITPSYNLKIE